MEKEKEKESGGDLIAMEWQLPIQKVEITNIHIGNPWRPSSSRDIVNKPMAPLSYFGTQFRLPYISLIFPPLPVLDYNPVSGKLVIDMSETSLASIKMNTLQETLINAILYHQLSWFNSNYRKEEIKAGFQPLIYNNNITFHCPIDRGIRVFKDGEWVILASGSVPAKKILESGMRIRIAVKINGISFLTRDNNWIGRSRLQHRVQGIICMV